MRNVIAGSRCSTTKWRWRDHDSNPVASSRSRVRIKLRLWLSGAAMPRMESECTRRCACSCGQRSLAAPCSRAPGKLSPALRSDPTPLADAEFRLMFGACRGWGRCASATNVAQSSNHAGFRDVPVFCCDQSLLSSCNVSTKHSVSEKSAENA